MTASGFQKTGWHWTRKGWKRTPKRLQQVKKVPLPTKRKTRKKAGITKATPREKPPTFAAARKLAAGQGRADSAPNPTPEAAKPATPPPRRVWSGKYADLTKPTNGEP
jgi:hypothetical protein